MSNHKTSLNLERTTPKVEDTLTLRVHRPRWEWCNRSGTYDILTWENFEAFIKKIKTLVRKGILARKCFERNKFQIGEKVCKLEFQ